MRFLQGRIERQISLLQSLGEPLNTETRVISGRHKIRNGLEDSGLTRNRCSGNAVDVGAVDAKVLQFARGHAAEFSYGLAILAPVVERACYVHDIAFREVSLTPATCFGSNVVLINGIYTLGRREKRHKVSGRPCTRSMRRDKMIRRGSGQRRSGVRSLDRRQDGGRFRLGGNGAHRRAPLHRLRPTMIETAFTSVGPAICNIPLSGNEKSTPSRGTHCNPHQGPLLLGFYQ